MRLLVSKNSLLCYLAIGYVALTPIFNVSDMFTIMGLNWQIPNLLKIIRALLLVLICLMLFSQSTGRRLIFSSLLIFILLFTIVYSSPSVMPIVLISGILSFLPITALYCKVEHAQLLVKTLTPILVALVSISLFIQIVQLFLMPPIFGSNEFGLSARNPGIYFSPSSMAFLSIITAIYYISQGGRNKIFTYGMTPLSIFLTASGSGVISILFMYLINFGKKVPHFTILTFFLISPFFYIFLPVMTGREDILTSLTGRFLILTNNIEIRAFSPNFGEATNLAVNLTTSGIIADSMITALIHNVGYVATTMILIEFLIRNRSWLTSHYWLVILSSSAFIVTVNVSEHHPGGFLLFLLLNSLVGKRN